MMKWLVKGLKKKKAVTLRKICHDWLSDIYIYIA